MGWRFRKSRKIGPGLSREVVRQTVASGTSRANAVAKASAWSGQPEGDEAPRLIVSGASAGARAYAEPGRLEGDEALRLAVDRLEQAWKTRNQRVRAAQAGVKRILAGGARAKAALVVMPAAAASSLPRLRIASWILTLALMGGLIALTSSCAGDGNADAAAGGTTTVETLPDPGPNEETRALMRHLDENFGPSSPIGQTSWYDLIIDVDCCSGFDGKATVETTTFSPSDAEAICTAVVLSGQVAGANVMNPEAGTIAECP